MVHRNLIANYLGQGWLIFTNLAFVPVYIKYLGIESYGLIGFFSLLQAGLLVLDGALSPTVSREVARYSVGSLGQHEATGLVRHYERLSMYAGFAGGLLIAVLAPWVAQHWLNAQHIPVSVVEQVIILMGLVIGFRFPEAIYRGCLVGLQRQVLFNGIASVMATIRAVGAVVIMAYISPSVLYFFLWQLLCSIATMLWLWVASHQVLPRPFFIKKAFSQALPDSTKSFSKGMLGISILSFLLMQLDKIILSKLLSLEQFGVYAFASMVATGVLMIVGPVAQTVFPRLTQLSAQNNDAALARVFHAAAQWVAVSLGVVTAALIFFGNELLVLWTHNPALVEQITPLLLLLLVGNLFNGLMWVPYQTQLAKGWTGLSLGVNVFSVLVLAPALLLLVPQYGAIAAAWLWLALNALYVVVAANLMFNRILSKERTAWYLNDTVLPLAGVFTCAWLGRLLFPQLEGVRLLVLFPMIMLSALMAGVLLSSMLRQLLYSRFGNAHE